MPSFSQFVRDQFTALPLPSATEVQGRTYVVTGANTGLGYECAKHLAGLGAAHVVLGVRSADKGKAAQAAIEQATGCGRDVLDVWQVDLASLDSVEACARRLDKLDRVDALINNGGVGLDAFSTVEGVETSLVVNVLGTMLLALRALPVLQATARKYGMQTRMEVIVSSTVTWLKEEMFDGLEGNIFEALSREETMDWLRYPKTKLFQTYAVQQLAALAPVSGSGVIINAVNPGLCSTSLGRDRSWRFRVFATITRFLMGRSAEVGSRTLLHGAVAEEASHGQWLSECEIKTHYLPPWIAGDDRMPLQKRVWNDMLATLAAKGHGVDIEGLLQKS